MAKEPLGSVLDYIRQIAGAPGGENLSDQELLQSFASDRDEAAFTLLVQRHGPLVWGVCRRVLRQTQDAEDAFQATFLVLARKAGRIRWQPDVSNWLYAVAWRAALKAKTEAHRRSDPGDREQSCPRSFEDMPATETNGDSVEPDIRPILDEELNRLPHKYRAPVVLHYLQGKTYTQAAEVLGWPAGTVSTRLNQARQLLRKRLARRGVGLTAGLLATTLAQNAAAVAVPTSLVDGTVKAATILAAGQAGFVVSTKIVSLTHGVLKAMFLTKLKIGAAVVVTVGVVSAGAAFMGHRMIPAAEAKDPIDDRPLVQVAGQDQPQNVKPNSDIDRLRKVNEDLRRQLRLLQEKVTALEANRANNVEDNQQVTYQGKPVDYWLKMFRDRDPEYRTKAIDALAAIGAEDNRVIPTLVKTLNDRNVRMNAASALGNIGKEAVPALLPLLKGKDIELRRSAAMALSQMGAEGKEAIPALIECLNETDQQLRSEAAAALGAMAPISKAAIPSLIKLLQWQDFSNSQIRWLGTIYFLNQFGEDAVTALTEALKDPNEKIRAGAAGSLALIGKPAKGAVPGLMSLLRDKDPLVRENAGFALIAIEDATVPALLEAMKDKDPEIRAAAAVILGQMALPNGVISQMDRSMHVRANPHISTQTAKNVLPALLKAMSDEDERVRKAASTAYEIVKKRDQIDPNLEKSLFDR